MLKTHHNYNAIRDGFPALHSARHKDVLEALSCASTWSLMTDGITEPTKMFAFLAVFVDRTTGELRCAFLDLTEIEAGVVLSWEDPAVAKECASMRALEARKQKCPRGLGRLQAATEAAFQQAVIDLEEGRDPVVIY